MEGEVAAGGGGGWVMRGVVESGLGQLDRTYPWCQDNQVIVKGAVKEYVERCQNICCKL